MCVNCIGYKAILFEKDDNCYESHNFIENLKKFKIDLKSKSHFGLVSKEIIQKDLKTLYNTVFDAFFKLPILRDQLIQIMSLLK